MARALTPTNLHRSDLIRALTDLAVLDVGESGNAFAEKLAEWLGLNDAITLRAIHTTTQQGNLAKADPRSGAAMRDAFSQAKAALSDSITQTLSAKGTRTRLALPVLAPTVPLDAASAYEPFRRYHLAHQRHMDSRIGPMRTDVRHSLGLASPALRSLAELDAVFDRVLREQEGKLLARLPSLMAQRFGQLHKLHLHTLAQTQQADQPAFWMAPGGWLGRFCHELQTVLLAELDFRLQPTLGLIEALNPTNTPPQ
jgi:hypothetical protein